MYAILCVMDEHKTPMDLRNELIDTKRRFGQGAATIDVLYSAADAYIAALKAFKKSTGKRLTIPSRAYLIRAI
jgi:hypothetical protein